MFTKKKIYIGTSQFGFGSKGLDEDFIRLHSIDKGTAEKLSFFMWSTKLTFDSNGKLIKKESVEDGEYSEE